MTKAEDLRTPVTEFMDTHIYAAEAVHAHQPDAGPKPRSLPPAPHQPQHTQTQVIDKTAQTREL